MGRKSAAIVLTEQELEVLQSCAGPDEVNRRLAQRAAMILLCAEGHALKDIARQLGTRPARVSKWRQRFLQHRVFGLSDDQRPGAPPSYDEAASRRVLELLDQPPPPGQDHWNGQLLAARLGDITQWQVWRILRRSGVQLQRRHSWVVRTTARIHPTTVDATGLYLDGSHNTLVLTAGGSSSPPREGFLRLTNKRVLAGLNRMLTGEPSWTLPAAVDAAGRIQVRQQPQRCRRSFLDFLDEVASAQPELRTFAVIDGLSGPRPEWDRWLKANPSVKLQFIPNRDMWLSQLEFWFGLLGESGASAGEARQLREAVAKLLDRPDFGQAAPFEWHRGFATSVDKTSQSTCTSAMELVSCP